MEADPPANDKRSATKDGLENMFIIVDWLCNMQYVIEKIAF